MHPQEQRTPTTNNQRRHNRSEDVRYESVSQPRGLLIKAANEEAQRSSYVVRLSNVGPGNDLEVTPKNGGLSILVRRRLRPLANQHRVSIPRGGSHHTSYRVRDRRRSNRRRTREGNRERGASRMRVHSRQTGAASGGTGPLFGPRIRRRVRDHRERWARKTSLGRTRDRTCDIDCHITPKVRRL